MTEPSIETLEDALFEEHLSAVVATVAGGMAHHFNNLLSGVLGLVSLAPTLDPNATAALGERLKSQIDDASHLIRVVLTLTRRSQSESDMKRCEAVAEVRDVVALTGVAATATATVETDLPDKEILLPASPVFIDRLLLTLLTAAVQRLSEGGKLRLALRSAGSECEFVVTATAPAVQRPGSISEALAAGDRSGLSLLAASRLAATAGGRLELGGSEDSLEWRVFLPVLQVS